MASYEEILKRINNQTTMAINNKNAIDNIKNAQDVFSYAQNNGKSYEQLKNEYKESVNKSNKSYNKISKIAKKKDIALNSVYDINDSDLRPTNISIARNDINKKVYEKPQIFNAPGTPIGTIVSKNKDELQRQNEMFDKSIANTKEYQDYLKRTNVINPTLRYARDVAQVNEKGTNFIDKALAPIVSGIDNVNNLSRVGTLKQANGTRVQLPTITDIKAQKAKEEVNNPIYGAYSDVSQSVGNMIPSLAANAILPGSGTLAFGVNAFTNARNEALLEGYDENKANAYAAINATLELGVGKVLGGTSAILGKSPVSKAIGNAISSKVVANPVISDVLADMASEFGEEYIQEWLDPKVKSFILDNKSLAESWDSSKFFDKQNFYAGLLGAISAGITNTPNAIKGAKNLNKQFESIVETLQTEGNQKLTNEEVKQLKKTFYDEYNKAVKNNTELDMTKFTKENRTEQSISNNIEALKEELKTTTDNKLKQELATKINGLEQELNQFKLPMASTEGMTLQESASKYNINPETQTSVQQLMENRNIESRWDSTKFKDNSVNALWSKDANGNRQVIFNPNASLDTIIEEVAVHELTHDILSSQNTTLNPTEILDYVSQLDGYNEARQSLIETYKDMYDVNDPNFNSLIDEEVVADVLGRKLGNQEFINNLVNSKPSIAKSIYNWVVSKLNSIVNKGKVRSEKLYWENIKNNFEKAYKQEYQNSQQASTKYKVSKQMLEKEFYNMTGDTKLQADAKMGRYAWQQIRKENGNFDGEVEAPYNEEAMKLYEQIENSKKSSSHLYHSTPVDRIQSIIKNGLQVGSEQNQKGVSSKDKLYLSATEELADSFTPENSVMLRISPSANLENLDYDLLGGEGSYTITNNIEPKYLQVKENGKWVNLLKSKYANENITDNQGRTLSKQQQEYFKDSKVRDNEGNLETVYHQTKNDFTEFKNGFSVRGFRNANFFTNQKPKQILKNMLEGYVRIDNPLYLEDTSIQQNIVDDAIANGYDGIINQNVQGIEGKNEIVTFKSNQFKNIDNTNPTTNEDIRYSKENAEWNEFLNKNFNDIRDRAKKELGTTTNMNEAGYLTNDGEYLDFSGKKYGSSGGSRQMDHRDIADIYTDEEYDSAEKKYSNMGSATAILQDFIDKGNIRLNGTGVEIATNPTEQQYDKLYDYLEKVQRDNGEVFVDLDTETKNRENLEYNDKTSIRKIINDIKEHYSKLNTKEVIDSQGNKLSENQEKYFKNSKVRNNKGELKILYHGSNNADITTFKKDKFGDVGITFLTDDSDIADTYRNDKGKKYKFYANITNPLVINGDGKNWNDILVGDNIEAENMYNSLTKEEKIYLTDLAKKMNDMYIGERLARENSVEGFYQRLLANNEQLYDKITQVSGIREKLFDTAKYNWNETYLKSLLGKRKNTNQLVKEAYDSGKYDGVIFENIVDRGAYFHKPIGRKISNVYVVFNSNQIKNINNLNPTLNEDIRYSKQNEQWDKWKDTTIQPEGTKTKLGDIKLPKSEVKLPGKVETKKTETKQVKKVLPKVESTLTTEEKEELRILKAQDEAFGLDSEETKRMDFLEKKQQGYTERYPGLKKVTDFKEISKEYGKFRDLDGFNRELLNNAESMIKGYRNTDRRTKAEWLSVARYIGSNFKGNSEDLTKYAIQSWFAAAPNQKGQLNRQGKGYVDFKIQEWINSVYDGARIGELDKPSTILPMAKEQPTLQINASDIASQMNGATKNRSLVGTLTESNALKDKVFIKDLDASKLKYVVESNQQSVDSANNHLDTYGYDDSVSYVKKLIQSNELPKASDVALAERVLQEAVKKGDTKTAQDLIMDIAILGTDLGKATQALSIIKKLTPEGQLQMYTKIIQRAKSRGEKSFQNVEITPKMVQNVLDAYNSDGTYDQQDLNNRVEQFKQDIAKQMKTTTGEKVNAWRYLAMLGNPKTHIRNIVSNVAMNGTIKVKNAMARTLETILPIKEKTKTWKQATDYIKDFSEKTATEMKDIITGEAKYNEKTALETKKQIFKNKTLEKISDFNSNALEAEDWFFSKRAFKTTLQEYLTANGINTQEDIKNNPEVLEKAKIYAKEQAEIATFRQYSKLASTINNLEKKSKLAKFAIEATIPFKKTPINVAKAGVKYSPLGLIKSMSYDIYQLKQGNINASQFIDNISQGLTGTSLAILGYSLAKAGILNGSGGDDKEDKYDSQLGDNQYSIKIGDNSYSISWLSPVAMPLLVGANAFEQLEEKEEWDMNVVSDTLAKTLDPLNEMSFMQGLTNALTSYGSGVDKIKGSMESVAQNYVGQFFPTIFSQFASTIDDKKRSTKASANSSYKFGEQTLRSVMYKLPGIRQKLEAATDVWGNEKEQADNIIQRAYESFLAPYSTTKNITTDLDKEIKRVYNETGENKVIPGIPYAYVKYGDNTYRMSANEYTKYKKTYGSTANLTLNSLINSSSYKNATNEDKAKLIDDVYNYARAKANEEYFNGLNVDYENKTLDKLNTLKSEFGINPSTYFTNKDEYDYAYKSPEKYKTIKQITSYDKYIQYKEKITNIKYNTTNDKEETIKYINSLNLSISQKAMFIKQYYKGFNAYDSEIINYINSQKLSSKDKQTILEQLGFTIREGRVYSK